MIKIKTLVENWTKCNLGREEVAEERARLKESVWALSDNGLISRETRNKELDKVDKAFKNFVDKIQEDLK